MFDFRQVGQCLRMLFIRPYNVPCVHGSFFSELLGGNAAIDAGYWFPCYNTERSPRFRLNVGVIST